MDDEVQVDALIDGLIDREGGYVDQPASPLNQPRPAELPLHDVRAHPVVHHDGPDRCRRPPNMAQGISAGMTAYLRGIPEELYALFGTGDLGYTAARTWG